jgi:3-hydroxyacyl-[acyl-carrier-protein] dehydratase
MLLKDFYTVKERVEEPSGAVLWKLELNPEHPVYAGHFPERAVVPGVCQIQMIKERLSAQKEMEMELMNAKSVKFLAPMLPDALSEVSLRLKVKNSEGEEVQLQAELFDASSTFCKLSGSFKAKS